MHNTWYLTKENALLCPDCVRDEVKDNDLDPLGEYVTDIDDDDVCSLCEDWKGSFDHLTQYTDDDIASAVEEYKAIQDDIDNYDGPVTCIFSFGYGDVWADGDVTAFGRVVFTVYDRGIVS